MTAPALRPKEHETVGRRFRAPGGAIYRCTRWARPQGFWMRLLDGTPWPNAEDRKDKCVSERAIDRTFHRLYNDPEPPTEHEQPCNCWICEGRPKL